MAFDGLNPLHLTINRLLESPRISIEPSSREILEHALYGVRAAVRVVEFLEGCSKEVGSKTVNVLQEEIREAARGLEDALDSHVSDHLSETESIHPLLISLDLEGAKKHIDGFTRKMKYLKKLFIPIKKKKMLFIPFDGADEERAWIIYWFASKAASMFLGMKADYIQQLDSLLPKKEEEEDDDDDGDEEDDEDDDEDDDDEDDDDDGDEEDDDDDEDDEEDDDDGDEEDDDDDDGDEDDEDDDDGDEDDDDSPTNLIRSWWVKEAASVFMMGKEYNPSPDEVEEHDDDDDDYPVSSTMVGLTDQFCEIRDSLLKDEVEEHDDDEDDDDDDGESPCTTLWGMAGLGKTAVVMKILQDPLIASCFESRVFLRIGPEYEVVNVYKDVLAQLDPGYDKIHMEDEDDIIYDFWKLLEVRKILIVFDDVWDPSFWLHIHGGIPYYMNNSRYRFLVTTRLKNEIGDATPDYSTPYLVRFLNNKESWDLLQEKVFAGEACPRELEKAGKQIAENCEGLPLLIITVAHLLSKAEKTKEYWTKIASSKKNSIFTDAYEKISKVLYPSYYDLPQDLKTCFLYLGAFPQNSEVRISKLTNLWNAEGLENTSNVRKSRGFVEYGFDELVLNSVALETQRSSYFNELKACTLHSVFWYLSKKEAWNEKFLHVLDSHLDASVEDIESRPRLSVYKNSIFSIKDVHHSLASISGIRALLCTGPYHPYQVPICFYLRLLKVLDALSIRFYEFPLEVVKLVHLRYLALTCNGNLPSSISKLWNLQCLIVHQHQSIKSSISESYLPAEIWDLLELEYLQIIGRNLPDPPPGAVLEKLVILLDVGAHTCTKRVFESIPNLEKLRVQIELTPGATEPLSFFDEISHLEKLFSLQCVIVNPEILFLAVAPAPLVSAYSLTKLTLSGFGYPWKDIRIIAKLPSLQVLKLRCYAFKGEEWEVGETEFRRLKYFAIEDTDLVEWTGGRKSFPKLEYLTIKNCYKLQEIPQMPRVREIQIVDCNPSAVTSAKQMAHNDCLFYVYSSWLEKGNLKARRQVGSKS